MPLTIGMHGPMATCRTTQRHASLQARSFADGDDALMASLMKRMDKVRESESSRQVTSVIAAAANWRTGNCTQRTIAILDQWVRRAKRVGDRLAAGTYSGDVVLVDVTTGEIIQSWESGSDGEEEPEVTALDFDGTYLSCGDSAGAVTFRRAGAEAPVLRASHHGVVSGVHWQGGGSRAYSCSVDSRLVCHDTEQGTEAASLNMHAPILAMSIGDEYGACALADGTVALCSLSPLRQLLTFDAHPGAAATAVHLVTPSQLLTGSSEGAVRLWRLDEAGDSSRRLTSFTGHQGPVVCLQGDGEKVVSGARDGTVRVWAAESAKLRFMLQGFTAYLGSLQLAPTWLLTDGTNNAVVLIDFSGESEDSPLD